MVLHTKIICNRTPRDKVVERLQLPPSLRLLIVSLHFGHECGFQMRTWIDTTWLRPMEVTSRPSRLEEPIYGLIPIFYGPYHCFWKPDVEIFVAHLCWIHYPRLSLLAPILVPLPFAMCHVILVSPVRYKSYSDVHVHTIVRF